MHIFYSQTESLTHTVRTGLMDTRGDNVPTAREQVNTGFDRDQVVVASFISQKVSQTRQKSSNGELAAPVDSFYRRRKKLKTSRSLSEIEEMKTILSLPRAAHMLLARTT